MATKRLTPLKAIRSYCVMCMGNEGVESRREVAACTDVGCETYAYRFGRIPKPKPKASPLKCIRKFCISCMNGSASLVRDCPSLSCDYYLYRLGKNPARAGIVHSGSFGQRAPLER